MIVCSVPEEATTRSNGSKQSETRTFGSRERERETSPSFLFGAKVELSIEAVVPDLARDSEPELKVLVVVGEVVLLHLCHVLGELGVVERVVHAVVEDVERERARDEPVGDLGGEDGVGEVGEGELEDEEQHRRHDEAETVLRKRKEEGGARTDVSAMFGIWGRK